MQLCARWRHSSLNRFIQEAVYSLYLWLMHALPPPQTETQCAGLSCADPTICSCYTRRLKSTQRTLSSNDIMLSNAWYSLFPIPYFFNPCSNIHRYIFPSFDEGMFQHSGGTWSFLRILDKTMKFCHTLSQLYIQ